MIINTSYGEIEVTYSISSDDCGRYEFTHEDAVHTFGCAVPALNYSHVVKTIENIIGDK